MKLVSVNTGLPREVTWHGTSVTTGIFKQPVQGRIALRTLNLDGDRQADLTVHGGEHKAVYCYPIEHYSVWRKDLPGWEFPTAVFGENFTTEGLLESSVHLGDQFSIGSAKVVVTQPRLPCYKLGIRFVARKARLRHDNFRGTDGELIAQMNGTLQQALGGEIFSKNSGRKFPARQVLFPNGVMLDGVAVDGFVLAAVNGEVGLTVAVQVEGAQGDAALDGLLEDPGGDTCAVPGYFPWEAGVYGN